MWDFVFYHLVPSENLWVTTLFAVLSSAVVGVFWMASFPNPNSDNIC
jgi:hypothetical protein